MVSVKTISDFINEFAPYETKCDWDNCGLLVGNGDEQVKKIGFALDLTSETLENAKLNDVDLIITHHPIIFKAQKNFLSGNMAFELAKSGINAISAHTCFDCAEGGVNDVLCEILSLSECRGIESGECVLPMARIGNNSCEMTSEFFARFVARRLQTTVRFVDSGKPVSRVAVCGGAGMSFIDEVIAAGADAYVTGDISHHEMLDAKEKGISVVAAGHFETEYPAMAALQKRLDEKFPELETVLLKQSNPVLHIK